MGHARALLGLAEDGERERLAQLVVQRGLSVRETEKLVANALRGEGRAVQSPAKPQLAVVSEVLKTASLRVELQQKTGGQGKLVVEFQDAVTRDLLLAVIRKAAESS
jgi:ParB family chromosome partitioning protein